MAEVAVLGLGAMGSRMAANLLKAGHRLTVWNRSKEAAHSLISTGARLAGTPREAAAEADFVIAMVRDGIASRKIWLDEDTGALAGLKAGAVAIESSTLTPVWIGELAKAASARGVAFLEAPVAGGRPQAEAAQLIYIVGGEKDVLARTEPLLKAMGTAVHHAGPVGAGAMVKLSVNSLLAIQVGAMAELIGLLQRLGADVDRAVEIIGTTPASSPAAKTMAASMRAGTFAPLFPVELMDKDLAYAIAMAGADCSQHMPLTIAAREVFQHGIDRGMGDDNITSIVRLYTEPR
ncbi:MULTISPECIES: NAD(P)-dependent oxidoreductase [unclassified Mesorhizobium]|uniref:NAD(P)-dependent oxidoreductase n=1 Tax=unclassified Mesorhizobium TaxID=325217 RepID=UPI00333833C1